MLLVKCSSLKPCKWCQGRGLDRKVPLRNLSILRGQVFCVVCRVLDAGEMTGFELASVANLQPETAEEAKILIPSLDVSPRVSQYSNYKHSRQTLALYLSVKAPLLPYYQ